MKMHKCVACIKYSQQLLEHRKAKSSYLLFYTMVTSWGQTYGAGTGLRSTYIHESDVRSETPTTMCALYRAGVASARTKLASPLTHIPRWNRRGENVLGICELQADRKFISRKPSAWVSRVIQATRLRYREKKNRCEIHPLTFEFPLYRKIQRCSIEFSIPHVRFENLIRYK